MFKKPEPPAELAPCETKFTEGGSRDTGKTLFSESGVVADDQDRIQLILFGNHLLDDMARQFLQQTGDLKSRDSYKRVACGPTEHRRPKSTR
jgi:hypothetical protein